MPPPTQARSEPRLLKSPPDLAQCQAPAPIPPRERHDLLFARINLQVQAVARDAPSVARLMADAFAASPFHSERSACAGSYDQPFILRKGIDDPPQAPPVAPLGQASARWY